MHTAFFNLHTLKRHRECAARRPDQRLWTFVGEEFRERLLPVNRSFSSVLDLSPQHFGGLSPVLKEGKLADAQWTQASVHNGSLVQKESLKDYDLILSALDAHWIDDFPGFLRNVRDLLSPDGLFLCAFWGGQTLHELRQALITAEGALGTIVHARVSPMIPMAVAARLLFEAGFVLPMVDQDTLPLTYPTLQGLVHHLRSMGETSALSQIAPGTPRLFREAETVYRTLYPTPEGGVSATFELITCTGWGPSIGRKNG